jgi:hypothetical protein
MMPSILRLLSALTLSSSTLTLAAPVALLPSLAIPQPDLTRRQAHSDPAAVPDVDFQGPPGSSGNLRGGADLLGYKPANPVQTASTQIPPTEFQLAPGQTEDADLGFYLDFKDVENFQPMRGSSDSPTDPGPRTYQYEVLNPDLYAPPGTDSGAVSNAKWPLGLSHNRHGTPATAGWARQENTENLPIATAMAGVDMRLSPNAYRELHWHQANEWSLILNGSVRLTASNEAGEVFQDDLQAGDVWL